MAQPPSPIDAIRVFSGPYRFLSNFMECRLVYDGVTYFNAEAAYQAQKTMDPKIRAQFSILSAAQAKRQGRHLPLRADWEWVKEEVMRQVVRAKFDQDPDLKQLLVETFPKHLEEGNTWGDTYWGTVGGQGQNKLGLLLMELREFYVREAA